MYGESVKSSQIKAGKSDEKYGLGGLGTEVKMVLKYILKK
jgi:hypothetical protein